VIIKRLSYHIICILLSLYFYIYTNVVNTVRIYVYTHTRAHVFMCIYVWTT